MVKEGLMGGLTIGCEHRPAQRIQGRTLRLRQVDENELLVIDVDGHIAIAGFGIIEPPRLSGGTAFNLGVRFTGGGIIP